MLRTFVAPLLTSADSTIRKPEETGGDAIHWLDELLRGGIQGPSAEELGRPLVVLLSGPPGAGKSLLVQQICYNIAQDRCDGAEGKTDVAINSGTSLHITTEVSAEVILRNLDSLGMGQYWSKDEKLRVYDILDIDPSGKGSLRLAGKGAKGFPLLLVAEACQPHTLCPRRKPEEESPVEQGIEAEQNSVSEVFSLIEGAWTCAVEERRDIGLRAPMLVVIDSLNIFSTAGEKEYLLESLRKMFASMDGVKSRPKYLFLVLDASADASSLREHAYWEYIADLSFRLDYLHGQGGYFTRQIEIVKARLQQHTLGKHVVKIFPKPARQGISLVTDPEGARPYIRAGGVFVFPSVHYILSSIRTGRPLIQAKPSYPPDLTWAPRPSYCEGSDDKAAWGPGRIAPLLDASAEAGAAVDWTAPSATLNWPTPWCFELVGGGIPLARSTAIIGNRGARKSYFAYQFLLDGIVNGEQTLAISFRDNPSAVLETMNHIAEARQYRGTRSPVVVKSGNPVIVFQRPGYVTPEELFQRVITAVGEYRPTRVVINAVDQWEAGYPLLAECTILVPALIDFLNTHKATSVLIGVEGGVGSLPRTGLTAKAEVVLSFEFRRIPWPPQSQRASKGPAVDAFPRGVPLRTKPGDEQQSKVVVRAIRVPRGSAGYGRAVLEYTEVVNEQPAALTMVPLAPEYPEGDAV